MESTNKFYKSLAKPTKDFSDIMFAEFSTTCVLYKDTSHIALLKQKLYHYTNINAMMGIIENNGIWLSEARYLNDKEELLNGRNLTIDVIGFLYNKKKYKIFQKILDGVADKLLEHKFLNNYICSFSTKKDDLEQWRAYSGNGSGVCIEFTRNQSSASLYEIPNFWKFYKVIYDDNLKKKIIHRFIFIYFYYFKQDIKNKNKYFVDEYIDSLTTSLVRIYNVFKHNAFKSEQEIRLIFSGNPSKKNFNKIHFRHNSNMIIPYIKSNEANLIKDGIQLSILQKIPISEILIGPTINESITKQSIEDFLNYYGFSNVKIANSNIPFR